MATNAKALATRSSETVVRRTLALVGSGLPRPSRRHEDGAREREPAQGHGGHLPVPVHPGVGEKGHEPSERDRDERVRPAAPGGNERRAQRDDEQREADGAQLGQLLDEQAVRVPGFRGEGPVA